MPPLVLSSHRTRLKAVFISCLPCCPWGTWQSPGSSFIGRFLVRHPSLSKFPALLFLSAAHLTSRFLLPALCSAPLFPCLPSLTANKAWYMYSGFTFFHPVIYAVRSFPLFGWPGFHVCAEQYLGVLTCSSVFSMKHTAAGNWWRFTATGCTVQTGRNPVSF